MKKSDAVAAIGQSSLLLPAWIKAALAANDRLKLYLTVLQAATSHADNPNSGPLDLEREAAAAGADTNWLLQIPAASSRVDGAFQIPQLRHLTQCMAADLAVMARPVLAANRKGEDTAARVKHWLDWLATIGTPPSSKSTGNEALTADQLRLLTTGKRTVKRRDDPHHNAIASDSLHLLVMDLHKALNQLAGSLSNELIDGAHVWQLKSGDRAHVAAFMRGLNRTAPLKLDHPGLDTAATRDGKRLLLQNDIGTNDAHVLVVQIEDRTITLSYSDLHRTRFEFFQSLLTPFGAKWSDTSSLKNTALNDGDAYTFGTAQFDCPTTAAIDVTLESIASRIVFLIDWNRARKRLLPFVSKSAAIGILEAAARVDSGHIAWLKAGGEQIVFAAMQAAGASVFRVGDRLDTILGADDAQAFLIEVLCLASNALLARQPVALVADETRMLLAKRLRQHSAEFDLIDEHAAYCHALAQAVSDSLAHDHWDSAHKTDHTISGTAAHTLAARAKIWERKADHLVMQARDRAQRQRRWQPFAHLMELSDDIADALEEAAFLMSVIGDDHLQGWTAEVHQILAKLAQSVLRAAQEHIKSLAIARRLGAGSEENESDAFLAASWNVLRSERECDELLRRARRAILASIHNAASLMLANDLAIALESASDRQLVVAYALRDMVFAQTEARA